MYKPNTHVKLFGDYVTFWTKSRVNVDFELWRKYTIFLITKSFSNFFSCKNIPLIITVQIYNFFNYQIFFKFFFVQKCSAHNYGANIMIISNHQIFNTVLFKFAAKITIIFNKKMIYVIFLYDLRHIFMCRFI